MTLVAVVQTIDVVDFLVDVNFTTSGVSLLVKDPFLTEVVAENVKVFSCVGIGPVLSF